MEILNIDDFVQVKRQIRLDGMLHNVLEISVQTFIDNLAAAKKLEDEAAKGDTPSMQTAIEMSVAAATQAIPTLAPERLRALPLTALNKLLEFIRGEHDPKNLAITKDAAAPAGEGAADPKAG